MAGNAIANLANYAPGYQTMLSAGTTVISGAVAFQVAMQIVRSHHGYRSEMIETLARAVIGVLLLHSLPGFGAWVMDFSTAIARSFGADDEMRLLGRTVQQAFVVGPDGDFNFLTDSIGPHMLMHGALKISLVVMGFLKILIIDMLQPLVFLLVLLWGTVSIPLSFIPHAPSVSNWLRLVLAVALWPVVYQCLFVVLITIFRGVVDEAVASLGALAGAEGPQMAGVGLGYTESTGAGGENNLLTSLKFIGLCLLAVWAIWNTPRITNALVMSGSGAELAGSSAAAVQGGVTKSAKGMSGAIFKKFRGK